jgi:lysophospholipid acyltransferase (LPLAT)-like uncharacterized protein
VNDDAQVAQRVFSLREKLTLACVSRVVAAAIALIGLTLRFKVVAEPGALPATIPAHGIYCFWHECTYSASWYFRKYNACILISRSFDGELIARTLSLLGFRSVRGSSSRGAVAGLLAMRQEVSQGGLAIFTADGPRGPIHQSKMGPVKLAQQTQSSIGCFHLHPARAWTLRSWDRFAIPLPFSTVYVSWARGLPPPASGASAQELEETRQALDANLERARRQALLAAGGEQDGKEVGL